MWLITTNGFYSAVQDRRDPNVVRVRCRTEEDAKFFVKRVTEIDGPKLSIEEDEHADYLYRVIVPRAAYAAFVMDQALEIDYDNFKDEVKRKQGATRAYVYMSIWSALLRLQPYKQRTWDYFDDLDDRLFDDEEHDVAPGEEVGGNADRFRLAVAEGKRGSRRGGRPARRETRRVARRGRKVGA